MSTSKIFPFDDNNIDDEYTKLPQLNGVIKSATETKIATNEKKEKENEDDKKKEEEKKRHRLWLILILLLLLLLLLLLIFLIILGAAPCQFKTCNANATCINQPFNAKCKCNYGFNGNGYECDECGLTYPNVSLAFNATYYSQYTDRSIPLPFSYPASVRITIYYEGIANYTADGGDQLYYQIESECDGVLVNRRSVLTSANCLTQQYVQYVYSSANSAQFQVDIEPDYFHSNWNDIFSVYVGLYQNFYSFSEVGPVQRAIVDTITLHDDFVHGSLNNDIAIIKLKQSITLNKYVQLACIPDSSDIPNETNYLAINNSAVSIGWGYYNLNNNYAYYLTDFDMNIMNNSYCSTFQTNTTNLNETICAGNYNNLKNSAFYYIGYNCQGALGSGLYINVTRNGVTKNLAVGININNTICGLGVYSNLFDYADWIYENSNY